MSRSPLFPFHYWLLISPYCFAIFFSSGMYTYLSFAFLLHHWRYCATVIANPWIRHCSLITTAPCIRLKLDVTINSFYSFGDSDFFVSFPGKLTYFIPHFRYILKGTTRRIVAFKIYLFLSSANRATNFHSVMLPSCFVNDVMRTTFPQ